MTLVVGYADGEIGFLVADTLVSYPSGRTYEPRQPALEEFHCLKIQIISPEVAIALAGDIDLGMTCIRALRKEVASIPVESVCSRLHGLRGAHAASGKEAPDFLVLWIEKSGSKRLTRVSDSGVLDCSRGYIGDPAEHRNFRAVYADYRGPSCREVQQSDGAVVKKPVTAGEMEFDQVSDAMEHLTHQRQSSTVGAICGCVVRVVDARISGKLEYMQRIETSNSAEEGKAGYSLLAANATEPRGIGLYFLGWHAGLVFIVGDSVSCRREDANTLDTFVSLAQEKYGLTLEGGRWQ